MDATENIVTLRMTAAWYAVLTQELAFLTTIAGGTGGHSQHNAIALHKMIMEQGGSKLEVTK